MIWGAVRNGKLVAEPTIEPFFWVGQLFSPIDPVPGDLTQTPIDSKSKRDWKDPKRIKEKNAGGNKNRVAAGSLLVIVDEYIIPGEGANVESIKSAENPEERKADEGGQEYVNAPV